MGDSGGGITITYSGSDVLLDSTSFSHLLATFSHQLPLRNLHWKPSASYTSSPSAPISPFNSSLPHPTSIRTIQSLGVQLEPIADTILRTKLKPETRHLIQRTLLERPFCHLYFVVCDDSDTYRSQIRNDIRSWLSTIQSNSTLSAATVTAKGFQGIESLQIHKNGSTSSLNNGSSTPRAGTPDVRPTIPSKDDDGVTSPIASTSKDKLPPPSPEYLIVVISPPDGSPLPLSSPAGRGSPAPGIDRPSSAHSSGENSDKPTVAPTKSGPARFFSNSNSSKGAVIDKVKADFNTSRRERVVHLTRLPPLNKSEKSTLTGQSDPTIFAELQTRLKECVSATFDAVVEMQGEVVKREGQKRNVPGWNFCKWMAGMECVACTFEGVGLYSDALAQYEEIEAAFLQCLQDRNLPFFPHVGGTLQGDDSAPLLDIGKKNYRDLILRNEISLFDFRTYVFAKRAILLGNLGRVSQVMNETPIFLNRVAAMLQEESLPRHFLESWTFSCSIDVVEQCQAWLVASGDASAPGHYDVEDSDSPSSRSIQSNAAFHSAKAELLDLARRQLDKIGIAVGHLPNAVPFTLSQSHGLDRDLPPIPGEKGSQSKISKNIQISRQELLSAIESRELFDLHYVSLTERVLTSWTSGGRQRNVLRLRCVLASLDFFRHRYSQAYVKFTVLPEPYAEGHWSLIEASHLAKQLECHAQLGKPYDQAWASVIIALLETIPRAVSISDDIKGKTQDISLRWLDSFFLYTQLRNHTQSFSQEIPISRFAPIQIQVYNQVARIASSGSQDGTEITVIVKNHSECSVEVDDVRVCVISGTGKEMWFTSGKAELNAGENVMTLSCFLFSKPGKYVVDVSQIRLSKVIVQYLHRKHNDFSRESTFVDILEDGDALQVDLELSKEVWLDRCRTCTMNIWTGRNEMDRLVIRLYDKNSGELIKGFLEATLERNLDDNDDAAKVVTNLTIDENENQLIINNLLPHSITRLTIPLLDFHGATDSTMSFSTELDYWDTKQPLRKRQIQTELRLSIGLPLGVNVQDFFRSDRLLSKFLISAGSGGYLRLGKVRLECEGMEAKEDGPFEIATSMQKNDTIVTPTQTASFLFSICKRQTSSIGSLNRNLRLTISYRTLHEEVVQILLDQLDRVLSKKGKQVSKAHKRNLQQALSSFGMNQTDLSIYLSKGRLQFIPRSDGQWRRLYRQWAGLQNNMEEENHIARIVRETLSEAQDGNIAAVEASQSKWQQLSLIVDVPRMNIVNAVTVDLEDSNQIVRIGYVVKGRITIETRFHWDDEMNHKVKKPVPSLLSSGHFEEKYKEDDEDDDAASFQDAKSQASTPTQSDGTITPAHSEKDDSGTPDDSNIYYLSIDINCDFVHWLLIGSKRTVIQVVRPEQSLATSTFNQVDFSLVAIKSGDLLLPSVTIWPSPDPIQVTPPSHAHRDKESNAKLFEEESKRMRKLESITCDSHIINEAKYVKVLPALQGDETRTYWMNV